MKPFSGLILCFECLTKDRIIQHGEWSIKKNHGDGHDAPRRKEEREKQNHGFQGKGIIWILFYTKDTIEGVGGLGLIAVL
jgi:hypothetical protein